MTSDRRVPMRALAWQDAVASFAEVALGYSRDEAMAEARRADGADLAPATSACPFGVDVPGLARLVASGDFDAAHRLVMKSHPWPGILGRHCHRPCEAAHNLGEGREALFISALERAASEHGAAGRTQFRAGPATGKRVAIVGAGSAAAAAAYALRQHGHGVVLYDQLPFAGGMTAVGYPDFRLPLAVVRRENPLEDWGVDVRFDVAVDRALVERLCAEFDAVIVGTGKFRCQPLDIPGEELDGVWDALDLLTRVKLGRPAPLGAKVVVIGAGYSAQDSSRTARRLGCEVTIYYRRREEDMPVNPTQRPRYVARQAAEGAPYVCQAAPLRILGAGGKVEAVELVRTAPGPLDDTGRPEAVPVPGSEFTVACDSVFAAVGELCDTSHLPAGIATTASGHVQVDPGTFATSVPRLYAVGEMTGAKGTETAYKTGFRCAASLDRFLRSLS